MNNAIKMFMLGIIAGCCIAIASNTLTMVEILKEIRTEYHLNVLNELSN